MTAKSSPWDILFNAPVPDQYPAKREQTKSNRIATERAREFAANFVGPKLPPGRRRKLISDIVEAERQANPTVHLDPIKLIRPHRYCQTMPGDAERARQHRSDKYRILAEIKANGTFLSLSERHKVFNDPEVMTRAVAEFQQRDPNIQHVSKSKKPVKKLSADHKLKISITIRKTLADKKNM